MRDVVKLPDPIGEVIRGYTLPNGLQVRQLRVPMGVVGMIYEARPNVTVDAAVLALKSGERRIATRVVVRVRLQHSPGRRHARGIGAVRDHPRCDLAGSRNQSRVSQGTPHGSGFVDVIIPRGGAELINSVVENATVPVIETGVGNCHVYVDADADVETAVAILLNAKTQRPSVCNAAESLLVHADIADRFLPVALTALANAGVTVHGDDAMMIVNRVGYRGSRRHRRRLGGGVLLTGYLRRRRAVDRRRDRSHQALVHWAHRGDRQRFGRGDRDVHRRGRLCGSHGQRLHSVYRRQRIWVRC